MEQMGMTDKQFNGFSSPYPGITYLYGSLDAGTVVTWFSSPYPGCYLSIDTPILVRDSEKFSSPYPRYYLSIEQINFYGTLMCGFRPLIRGITYLFFTENIKSKFGSSVFVPLSGVLLIY